MLSFGTFLLFLLLRVEGELALEDLAAFVLDYLLDLPEEASSPVVAAKTMVVYLDGNDALLPSHSSWSLFSGGGKQGACD